VTKLKIQSLATVQSNSGWYPAVSEVHLVELLIRLASTLLQKCHEVGQDYADNSRVELRIRNHQTRKLDKNYRNILEYLGIFAACLRKSL
jgi:hypothetical protein